jgi:hypothetical protein
MLSVFWAILFPIGKCFFQGFDHQFFYLKDHQILHQDPVYRGMLKHFLLSYLVYSQIWLNQRMDNHHSQLHHKVERKNTGTRALANELVS